MYYSYVYRRYVWLWPVVHKSGPSSMYYLSRIEVTCG